MPRTELLHPMIVHFPIALFFTGVGLEIISHITQKELFQKIAFANYALATAAAIGAAIFGTISSSIIPHNEEIHSIMEVHQTLGWFTVVAFAMLTILNYMVQFRSWSKPQFLNWVLIVVAGVIITWGATLGGKMVFEEGAAVKPLYERFEEAEAGHYHHHGEAEAHKDHGEHDEHAESETMEAHEHGDEHNDHGEMHEETEAGRSHQDSESGEHTH